MSGKTYSYSTTPTGQETLVTTTEQLIEVNQSPTLPSVVEPRSFCCQDFNNFVEEEKGRRHESINQVQKFAMAWEKILQEESEKNVASLYEKLQESLETIQTALSSVETSEGQLQKVVSFSLSLFLVSLSYFFCSCSLPSSKSSASSPSPRPPSRTPTLSREEKRKMRKWSKVKLCFMLHQSRAKTLMFS